MIGRPHCSDHPQFDPDCIDCDDALRAAGRPGNDPEDEDEDREGEDEPPARLTANEHLWGIMWEAWANSIGRAILKDAESDSPPLKRDCQSR